MKNYILPIILIIVYITGIKIPVYPGAPLINHLVYFLFHTNLLHLIINIIAWFVILRMHIKSWILYSIVITTSIIGGYFAFTPTLGISGGLFGITGFAYGTVPKKSIKETIIVLALILLTILLPGIAGFVHLAGFASGYIIAYSYGRVRGY